MSKQQIFDTVVEHFKKQKVRAYETHTCVYRSKSGLKCAIGCLISDDDYKPGMEGNSVYGLHEQHLLPEYLKPYLDSGILYDLQGIHDKATRGLLAVDTAVRLKVLAERHNLDSSKVDWA